MDPVNEIGTTEKPFLVQIVPRKTGGTNGHKFIFKIEDKFYEGVRKEEQKKWVTLRCQTYRKANAFGEKCKHIVRVQNVSGVTKEESPEIFSKPDSWNVLETRQISKHCCDGYPVNPAMFHCSSSKQTEHMFYSHEAHSTSPTVQIANSDQLSLNFY